MALTKSGLVGSAFYFLLLFRRKDKITDAIIPITMEIGKAAAIPKATANPNPSASEGSVKRMVLVQMIIPATIRKKVLIKVIKNVTMALPIYLYPP